jgi:hypothetical protein
VAVGLFHDFARDLHLQAELLGRTPDDDEVHVLQPGETQLPLAADLVGAIRRGRFTFRATVGGEAGAAFAHAPLHTDFALLTGLLSEERFGFVAVEARADWAREAPLVLAPEYVADTTPIGLPFRLGVAFPFNVGADREPPRSLLTKRRSRAWERDEGALPAVARHALGRVAFAHHDEIEALALEDPEDDVRRLDAELEPPTDARRVLRRRRREAFLELRALRRLGEDDVLDRLPRAPDVEDFDLGAGHVGDVERVVERRVRGRGEIDGDEDLFDRHRRLAVRGSRPAA